jgi:hypothetical protein
MADKKPLLDAVKDRRSIYSLAKESTISDERIKELVEFTIKHAPSAFNVQVCNSVCYLVRRKEGRKEIGRLINAFPWPPTSFPNPSLLPPSPLLPPHSHHTIVRPNPPPPGPATHEILGPSLNSHPIRRSPRSISEPHETANRRFQERIRKCVVLRGRRKLDGVADEESYGCRIGGRVE